MGAIHIGTSGWTYDDWSGPFYPADVKGADRLSYYATHFDTVFFNNDGHANAPKNAARHRDLLSARAR